MSFPTKKERNSCWEARDRYWNCLDEHKIENANENSGPCLEFRKIYQLECPSTWVKHFDRKYKYLQFKSRIEKEGYEPLDKLK